MFNILTKKVVPNKNGQYFLDSKAISQVKCDKFVKGKLTEEESFWHTMTKEKLSTFAANNKTVKVPVERKIVNIGGNGKYSGQKPLFLPPHTQILEHLLFPCFFVSEKFVTIIINVIISFMFLLSIKYWVGGDDFLSKSWKKRS